METQAERKDYLSVFSFLKNNEDESLVVFIVDDNVPYLNLVKKLLDKPNFSVFTFTTGEECLEYLQLQPDLVILDYHLDSVNPYAMKGDRIAEFIEERVPDAEILLISSDNKFNLINDLHFSGIKNIIYKDEEALLKIKNAGEKIAHRSISNNVDSFKIAFYILLGGLILENIILILTK